MHAVAVILTAVCLIVQLNEVCLLILGAQIVFVIFPIAMIVRATAYPAQLLSHCDLVSIDVV